MTELGAFELAIGLLYIFRRAGSLKISLGPGRGGLSGSRGSVALGLFFGLNIPACAALLIFALLGMAAAGGVSGASLSAGFVSLGLFGFALSLPRAAVLIPSARRALDWLCIIATTTALDRFTARRPWPLVDRLRLIHRDQGAARSRAEYAPMPA